MAKHRFLNFLRKFKPTIKKIGPNMALIVENKYTKFKSRKVKVYYNRVDQSGRGWRIIFPFLHETDVISIKEDYVDYPSMTFNDKVGQKLTVDFTAKIQVTDVRKYKYSHENVKEQLQSDITSKVLPFIKKFDYDELTDFEFELPPSGTKLADFTYAVKTGAGVQYVFKDTAVFDSNGQIIDGELLNSFEVEMIKLREYFDKFEEKYGLRVINLSNKEVQPSEEMQKSFDQLEKVKRQNKADKANVQARKEIAQIEKEIMLIYGDGDAEVFRLKYEQLKKNGLNDTQILDVIKTEYYAKGLMGGNQNQSPAAMGAMGAMGALYTNRFMNNSSEDTSKRPKQ